MTRTFGSTGLSSQFPDALEIETLRQSSPQAGVSDGVYRYSARFNKESGFVLITRKPFHQHTETHEEQEHIVDLPNNAWVGQPDSRKGSIFNTLSPQQALSYVGFKNS